VRCLACTLAITHAPLNKAQKKIPTAAKDTHNSSIQASMGRRCRLASSISYAAANVELYFPRPIGRR